MATPIRVQPSLFLLLEVVVNTEAEVRTIEVETKGVSSLGAIVILLLVLPAQETSVGYEAELIVEVNSNTWLDAQTEGVYLVTCCGIPLANALFPPAPRSWG
jgi:hypothetical protein